jgi:sigma-B regulation protein RsbU (phosphoserine phosphatase)
VSFSQSIKTRVTLLRLFGVLLALYAILQWILKAEGLATFFAFVLVIVGGILAVRLIRHVIRKSIWRLRYRLIVTYVFIGVVPIVLILTLAVLGTVIVVGQVAVYLVSSELERRAAVLTDPARVISQARPADRAATVREMGDSLAARMPGLQIAVSGASGPTAIYPAGSTVPAPIDGWKDFTGYITRDRVFYSASVSHSGGATVIAMAPITKEVLENTVPGIGALTLLTVFAGRVPPAYNDLKWLDFAIPWINSISYRDWNHPADSGSVILSIETRPSAVLGAVFGQGFESGKLVLIFFVVVASTLLCVWLVSIVIGLSLTRTITAAVHRLYEGTLQIAKGDFSWRIPVSGNDQLADLGRSFNNMAAQIENLVVIAREKERLQSEVEIASEVQNQLFPRSAPVMQSIELMGICHPARTVSGDYYDYLCLPDGNLAVAIGDVAGKGISAALLMASIQSIIRTQLAAGLPLAAAAGNGHVGTHFSTSSIVAQLNRQLYASTSPEKYATFFFGAYDERSRVLTYTNAGHLPPLLLRAGEVTLLEVTGTVVGLFPAIRYEEQTVQLRENDLLIAYTDGITEPENAYGEEFGSERLAETVLRHQNSEPKEIVAKIMEAVTTWSTAPELPDDMTVVIARGLA